MLDVSSQALVGEPALLRDYSRRAVTNQPFPALIHASGEEISGVLYRDVSDQAVRRLDRFEGQMYARQPVLVALASGEKVACETYVVEPEYLALVADGPWDFEHFKSEGRALFEANYAGYEAI